MNLDWSRAEKKYLIIPYDIVGCTDRFAVAVLAYLEFRRDLDNCVWFTMGHLINWCGYTPNSDRGKTNSIFKDTLFLLNDMGYITFDKDALVKANKSELLCVCFHNGSRLFNKRFLSSGYSVLYADEIMKIRNEIGKAEIKRIRGQISVASALLVLAYLRSKIHRRNKTEQEDKLPEVYADYYEDIASCLDLGEKTFSLLMELLSSEQVGILYVRHIRVKAKSGKWVTKESLICNRYKRYGNETLLYGEDYYLKEIKAKCEKMGYSYYGDLNDNSKSKNLDLNYNSYSYINGRDD